jgi:thioester reductase-like protein
MAYTLLTGGTGLLGRYLMRDLTLADVPLAVVVRRERRASAVQRVETVMARWEQELGKTLLRPVVLEGDLCEPNLGLDAGTRTWVAQHCRSVVHSAASLTFYNDERSGEPWRSNVAGTRHVFELCRQAGVRECHHVSTAYVCGTRRGRILESELDVGQQPGNDYERTKLLSEQEVLASPAFDSVTVYRPSIIVGDQLTGYTSSFHGFYTPLRILSAVPLELVPHGDWLGQLGLTGREHKNLVPVDWVSAAIAWIVTRPALHGRTYHLTNPASATSGEMGTAIGEALEQRAARGTRQTAAGVSIEASLESFREQMKIYQSYWSGDPEFDSSQTQQALPHLPCPAVDVGMMRRLIRFAFESNFGWPLEQPIVPDFDVGGSLERWLAAGLAESRDASDRRYVSLQVSGRGGGQWHLVADSRRLVAARPGSLNGDGTTCYLTSTTFAELAGRRLTFTESIDSGRLVVAGNSVRTSEVARIFQDLLSAE